MIPGRVRPAGSLRPLRGLRSRSVSPTAIRPLRRTQAYRYRHISRGLLILLLVLITLAASGTLLAIGMLSSGVPIPHPPTPSVSAPNVPSLPSISGPSVTAPSLPSLPGVSAPSLPSLPSVSAPNISAPSVSLPNVSAPSISLPNLSGGDSGANGGASTPPGDIYSVKYLNIRHLRFVFIWRVPWWILAALALLAVAIAGRHRSPVPSRRWAITLDVLLAALAMWLLLTAAVKVPDLSLGRAVPRPVQTTRQVLEDGTTQITELHIIDDYPPAIDITVDLVLLAAAATLVAGRRLHQLHAAPVTPATTSTSASEVTA